MSLKQQQQQQQQQRLNEASDINSIPALAIETVNGRS